ncbi:putative transcription factor interactor and regulator CCHC(Zn) family [Helianthus anomalus]
MVPKGFVKKPGMKRSAPVGRPRKPGIRCFKCKQFGHITSICPSKYVNLSPLPAESNYLVKDTCGGKWDSVWVVDPTYKTHMTGNRNVFKYFKRHFGLVTNENRKDFSFVHGFGEVRVPVDGRDKTIPCVSYVPSLDQNVLSLEQLLFQGIETVKMGDTCLLKKMFGSRSKGFDIYDDKSEVDLEQDYLNTFYDNLDVDNGYKKEKDEFQECLEDYYEKEFEKERNKKKAYGESSRARKKEIVYSKKAKKAFMIYFEDVIENNLIIESCLEAKDLITLHEELENHQRFYDAPFEDVIIWFIPSFLGIVCEKAMPPELIDGREVSLILLHRIVRLNGGFKEVMEKNLWDVIAAKYGYEPGDAHEVKVAYIYYLELVEWYFDFMKGKRGKNANVMDEKSNNNGWIEQTSDDEVVVKIEVTNNCKK